MPAHPCKLNYLSNRSTECLYCHKYAAPAWYCRKCEVTFCFECHETLQRETVPNWREELSLHRDQYFKQLNARRTELPTSFLPEICSIVASYDIEPIATIVTISGGTYWFRFGNEKSQTIDWIDEEYAFDQTIRKASLGKISAFQKSF